MIVPPHGGNKMFIKDWKREVFTIPNLLSLFRLLLIPAYTSIYLNAREFSDYFLAASVLAISCLTDMMDGIIARRFHMITNVGKILDPLADKMTQFSLTICLSVRYPALRGVLILFVIKELFQSISLYILFRGGKVLPGALFAGKLCTTVLFISFITLILIPVLPDDIVTGIAVLDSAILAYAFICYFLAIYGKNQKLQNFDP